MKRKMTSLLIIVTLCLLTFSNCTFAEEKTIGTREDTHFYMATTFLLQNKITEFSASTMMLCNSISINSCTLYRQRANGSWEYVCSLPAPTEVAQNTAKYGAMMDYSSYITTSGTYRIYTVWNADGHTMGRYSNTRVIP